MPEVDVSFLELGVVTLDGRLRTRSIPRAQIDSVIREGFGFDGSSLKFVPIEDSDLVAIPDIKTLKIFTFNGRRVGFALCDVYKDEEPLPYYPRFVAKRVASEFEEKLLVGPEMEFYAITREPQTNEAYMWPAPQDSIKIIKQELMQSLIDLGIEVRLEHHEVAECQHEVVFHHKSLLEMADLLIFAKYFAKLFFFQRGIDVTFMPKPFQDLAGSGMHCHLSLWRGNENLFEGDGELSNEGKSFLAGVLRRVKEFTIFSNNTVNSFKRLVPGFEAPVYVTWGYGNRTTLVRIPSYTSKLNRIEVRSPDPLSNPYFTFTAILLAGMEGMKAKAKLPPPTQENVYEMVEEERVARGIEPLPASLKEAIEMAEKSEIVDKILGPKGKKLYLEEKKREWERYLNYLKLHQLPVNTKAVTKWEKERYFHA